MSDRNRHILVAMVTWQKIMCLKMGKIQETPYTKGKTFFNISFNTGHICMGFAADNLERYKYLLILKCLIIYYADVSH